MRAANLRNAEEPDCRLSAMKSSLLSLDLLKTQGISPLVKVIQTRPSPVLVTF